MRQLTFAALFVLCGGSALAGEAPKPGPAATLAQKLVADSARVGEGEFVLITGTFDDRDLLEELAVAVRRAGGNPLLMVDSDAMLRRSFLEVPEKYDAQAGAWRRKLADAVDVRIKVDRGEGPDTTADIPPARITTAHESFEAATSAEEKKSVRRVVLGNGLYPTEFTAKKYGLTLEALTKIFTDGINVDYQKLEATGAKARAVFAKGKLLEITAKNGTNLRMRIEGRQALASDGVISADDVKKGGPNTVVWLPAGEVYTTPVLGTVEGKVVIDRQIFQNTEVTGLTLEFKAGKLASMTAKTGLDVLKQDYEAAPPGKELFGLVDLGINPSIKIPPGCKLLSYLPAGSIMVSLGGNEWAGGENKIVYTLDTFLSDATLKVDGKVLVDKGVLKL